MINHKTKTSTGILVISLCLCMSFTALADSDARAAVAPSGDNYYSQSAADQFRADTRSAYHYERGVQHFENSNLRLAERAFKQSLRAGNEFEAKASAFLGLINAQQNDHKSAVKFLRRATRSNPELYGLKSALGLSYVKLGRIDDAQAVLADLKAKKDRSVYQGDQKIDLRSSLQVLEQALN